MSDADESWVFDSLVCFLNGPIWNAPLQSFIDEKSLIFEPGDTENEEYRVVFDEFKNLVDFMLGNFMEDIGISPEQFEQACSEGKNQHVSFDHNLFEQIWAANDFEMFTRLMTQKNVELQLQALELIERKYGITPQSFIPNKSKEGNTEANVVKEVPINMEQPNSLENEVLREVEKKFPEEITASSKEIENIMEEKPILKQKLRETKEKAEQKLSEISRENSNEDIKQKDVKQNANLKQKETPAGSSSSIIKPKEVDALELKKRQDYLRAQRDKLVALKKEARQKQLTSDTASKNSPKNRPRSAKAANAVLTGEKPEVEQQQLQIRKTLAERLKTEVIGKEK